MDDRSIVELYLKRDESSIEETSKKYGKRLYAISRKIVDDCRTAEECENDTYMQAWQLIPPNDPRDHFFAFLARIVRSLSLNRCRKLHAEKRSALVTELSSELEECISSPDDTECRIDEKQLRKLLNSFLSGLTDEKRNIFLRRYWFGDSIEDISSRFRISESKAKTTLYRVRNDLKKHLKKEGYEL